MKTHRLAWSTLAVAAALSLGCGAARPTPLATEVGAPVGSPATATLGAAGGSLASPDGRVKLTVPAGALAADTALTVQPVTGQAPGARGNAYRFTPDGQAFQKPVSLTFSYGDADLANTAAEALGLAYQSSDGQWHWVAAPALDAAAKTVTVSTDHFTDYAPVAAFGFRPASASVAPGKSLTVGAVYCYLAAVAPADKDLGSLPGIDCGAGLNPNDLEGLVGGGVTDWTVNGVAGGSPSTGTITGASLTGTYTAPSRPLSGPVTVSGRMRAGPGGSVSVSARLTVGNGPATYSGTLAASGTLHIGSMTAPISGSATVRLTQTGSGTPATYEVDASSSTGSITQTSYTDIGRTCTQTSASASMVAGQLSVDFSTSRYTFSAFISDTALSAYACTDTSTGRPTADEWQHYRLDLGNCTFPTEPATWQPFSDGAQLSGSCDMQQGSPSTDTLHVTWTLRAGG